MRLLVVDDSPEMREMIGAMLDDSGHDVIAASNYAEALEILHSLAVNACLTDVHYPRHQFAPVVKAGLELATDCAALGIPCALMSGMSIMYAQHPEFSAYPFLLKPFSREALKSVVQELAEVVPQHAGESA